MHISGVVTKPSASRKSRAMQFFFINSRLVKCQTAMAALEQAYKNSIMVGKFPGCVLNIECSSSFVDVNVHPAKIEVRFANERPVFELVYYGVKSAIEQQDTPKEIHFEEKKPVTQTASGRLDIFKRSDDKPQQMEFKQKKNPENFWNVASVNKEYKTNVPSQEEKKVYEETLNQAGSFKAEEEQPKPVEEIKEPEIDVPDFRVIGEAFKTYIIVEIENALYLIDKHAAHERMNFEKLKKSTEINSQLLLSPVAVRLTKEEHSVVCDNLELYKKCGFLVEDFGDSSVIVRECPSMLSGEDIEELICETAGKLLEGKTDITPDKMDWIFHSTSCRAAVKAGDYTSPYERELFVKKLLSMPDIRYCPHGRPVMIKMTKYEIEKLFGRS